MKRYAIDLAVLLIPLAILLVFYPALPDQIPLQWQLNGSVRYGAKSTLFLIAVLPFVVYEWRKQKNARQ